MHGFRSLVCFPHFCEILFHSFVLPWLRAEGRGRLSARHEQVSLGFSIFVWTHLRAMYVLFLSVVLKGCRETEVAETRMPVSVGKKQAGPFNFKPSGIFLEEENR